MRIVVYPHVLTIGGSQLNAIELAAAVRDRGHHVTVFAAKNGALATVIADFRLPLVLAPPHHRRPSPVIAGALRDLCLKERIDIVHTYEWPPCLEAFYGPLLFDGVRTGCTVMSMSVAPFIPPSVPLVVGTQQIAAATGRGRRGAVSVIEPPVDVVSNHPAFDGSSFRREYGLGENPVVVVVSRLAEALKLEGLERAVAAAELLAPETGVRLVIVGDGPARSRLEEAAATVNEKTGRPTVTLTGELPDPRAAYAAADVVLGMGGSALRAMAFAKPVVVLGEMGFAKTLTAESAEIFLWQGFYGLGDGDLRPATLAAEIAPLLRDAAYRRQLGRFARSFVESRFSLRQSAEAQERLYSEWIAEPLGRLRAGLEAAAAGRILLGHKILGKWRKWRGRRASEDFNSVDQIAKVANSAGPNGTRPRR
jgi:glycosyltransferase involved in cell wall biosynthesis